MLLHVVPEVSTPEKDSGGSGLPPNMLKTTLQTDVMLNDNEGMIIGGLINDQDSTAQSKIPYLGNLKGIGFLFRRTVTIKERHEIIVALVPRIQPYDKEYHDFAQGEWVRTSVPLFHGPLCRTDRPWDPVLPDGKRIYYPLIPPKDCPPKVGYFHNLGGQYVIPPCPLPHQNMCDVPCGPEPPFGIGLGPQPQMAPTEELPLPVQGGESNGSEDHQRPKVADRRDAARCEP